MSGRAKYQSRKREFSAFDPEKIWSLIQLVAPILMVVIYTLFGALIFHTLEAEHEHQAKVDRSLNFTRIRNQALEEIKDVQARFPDSRLKDEKINAIIVRMHETLGVFEDEGAGKWSFLGSLYYSMTLYTTIGYGDFAPKTTAGQVATMLYVVIGIPLTLTGIIQMGTMITSVFIFLWRSIRSLFREKRSYKKPSEMDKKLLQWQTDYEQAIDESEIRNMDIISLPLSFVFIMTAGWIALSAGLFLLWEEKWDYFTSFYFTVISFTTVGLGDLTPDHTKFTVLYSICFMLVGVALLSAFFSLLQEQTDSLFDELELNVEKNYLAGQVAGDTALPMSEDPNEIDAEIGRMLNKLPFSAKFLYSASGEKRKLGLKKKWAEKASKKPKSTQTTGDLTPSAANNSGGKIMQPIIREAEKRSKSDVDSLVELCGYDY